MCLNNILSVPVKIEQKLYRVIIVSWNERIQVEKRLLFVDPHFAEFDVHSQ